MLSIMVLDALGNIGSRSLTDSQMIGSVENLSGILSALRLEVATLTVTGFHST